jgi:hypothetical protein
MYRVRTGSRRCARHGAPPGIQQALTGRCTPRAGEVSESTPELHAARRRACHLRAEAETTGEDRARRHRRCARGVHGPSNDRSDGSRKLGRPCRRGYASRSERSFRSPARTRAPTARRGGERGEVLLSGAGWCSAVALAPVACDVEKQAELVADDACASDLEAAPWAPVARVELEFSEGVLAAADRQRQT